MKRTGRTTAKILTGFFVTAMYAMPQAYTVSAKPGVVNYIEGNAFINGSPLSAQSLKAVFLNANDTISTDIGKAEVLLSPGVFLRLGDDTQARMVSPSLIDTQVELKAGAAMVEIDDIVKDSRITVLAGGSTVVLDRNGLFRFSAGDSPSLAVLEGKASVVNGDRKTDIGKGKEFLLGQAAKPHKFDTKKPDELYAWSNVRAEYNAASSYQAARDVNASGFGGVWGGYGFSGYGNPGWMWNSGFNSWSWLPGNGAFYSPFGFGFYAPGAVGYAPVIYAPIYGGGGGYWNGVNRRNQQPASGGTAKPSAPVVATRAVPVNPVRPPAVGNRAIVSPFANQAARSQATRSFSSAGGFRTASGATIPAGRAASGFGGSARGPAGGSARGAVGGGARSGGGSAGASAANAGGFGGGGARSGGGGGGAAAGSSGSHH